MGKIWLFNKQDLIYTFIHKLALQSIRVLLEKYKIYYSFVLIVISSIWNIFFNKISFVLLEFYIDSAIFLNQTDISSSIPILTFQMCILILEKKSIPEFTQQNCFSKNTLRFLHLGYFFIHLFQSGRGWDQPGRQSGK